MDVVKSLVKTSQKIGSVPHKAVPFVVEPYSNCYKVHPLIEPNCAML